MPMPDAEMWSQHIAVTILGGETYPKTLPNEFRRFQAEMMEAIADQVRDRFTDLYNFGDMKPTKAMTQIVGELRYAAAAIRKEQE